MQPSYIAFIMAFAASVTMAAPVADAGAPEFVEIHSEPAKYTNGTIVWLGEPEDHHHRLDRRACRGSSAGDAPSCYSSHGARNDVCISLLTELQADSANVVQKSPRQICYRGTSDKEEYCCVSWAKQVSTDITKGMLSAPVSEILSQCTQNGVSGLVRNINLGGVACNTVCLSDRGTGCS